MNVTIHRAAALDAPGLAQMLRELGLLDRMWVETPQSTRERVAGHLQLYHRDDCHSLNVAVATSGEIVDYGALLETVKAEALSRGCSRLTLTNRRQPESYARGYCARRGGQERTEAAGFAFRLAQPASRATEEMACSAASSST